MLRILAPLVLASALAASDSQPHYHRGKLAPYQIERPSVLLSASDESRLRSGRAVMQALVADDGLTRRMIMVQDISTPASVVLGRILDLNAYDRMVSGVDSCLTYCSSDSGGLQTVKSTYEISALHMKYKYYVEHTFDPSANCMTFRLDYDRRSDIDDTVGYWYVDPTGRASCRVYYSCECKLRGWVPGPVYNLLTKEALKKATVWVSHESIKEYRAAQSGFASQALVQFVSNVRTSIDSLKLPQPPMFASKWAAGRKEAAVRLVSAVRSPQRSGHAVRTTAS
jgi:hypothetical protein